MGEAISVESDSLRPVGAKSYFDQIKYQNTIGVKDSQWTMKYKFEKGNFILNINTQNDLFQIHIIIHIFEGFLHRINQFRITWLSSARDILIISSPNFQD